MVRSLTMQPLMAAGVNLREDRHQQLWTCDLHEIADNDGALARTLAKQRDHLRGFLHGQSSFEIVGAGMRAMALHQKGSEIRRHRGFRPQRWMRPPLGISKPGQRGVVSW